jgi:hypothetical protein
MPALLTRTSSRPNPLDHLPDHSGDRRLTGDVEVEEGHALARGDVLGVAACSDHLEARFDQRERGCSSDAGGRTRHEGYRPPPSGPTSTLAPSNS